MDDTYDNSSKEMETDDFESKIGIAWTHGREYVETIRKLYVLKAVSLASNSFAEAFSFVIILMVALAGLLMLGMASGFWIHAARGWSYPASFSATAAIFFFISLLLLAWKKFALVSPLRNRIIGSLLHHDNDFKPPIANATDENERDT